MTTKAKDGRETLQERLQARIDKHRDPRGNICLGTYNHWDSALDLEAIGSLDAAQAEIARLKELLAAYKVGKPVENIDNYSPPLPAGAAALSSRAADIIAGIKQFGLAADGSDLRDLQAIVDAARQPEAAPEGWRPIKTIEQSFQARVQPWMLACFNEEIAADRLERGDRFIEEALELVQSGGYDKERAHALVEYVYGRPQGDVNQEVGGVMVTLAAYCLAFGVDMHVEAERELARINEPEIIEKIRAKQASKPNGSALPIATPASAVASEADPLQFTLGNGTVAVDTGTWHGKPAVFIAPAKYPGVPGVNEMTLG
jgi:NTP pyrophosphatase (non-canonical NTP hydrolase)